MPVVAARNRSDPWQPALGWPADAYVQWGRSGLVLPGRDGGGGYVTAFFEALPAAGGFVRGEGADPAAAEAAAFAKWRRGEDCPGHRWGRKGYANGAGFCRNCGTFGSKAFRPLHDLHAWRDTLSASELDAVSYGCCAPSPEGGTYGRRLWLRARLSGIAVPEPEPADAGAGQDAYAERCLDAVLRWVADAWHARGALPRATGVGIEGLFERAARQGLVEEAVERGYLPASAAGDAGGADPSAGTI